MTGYLVTLHSATSSRAMHIVQKDCVISYTVSGETVFLFCRASCVLSCLQVVTLYACRRTERPAGSPVLSLLSPFPHHIIVTPAPSPQFLPFSSLYIILSPFFKDLYHDGFPFPLPHFLRSSFRIVYYLPALTNRFRRFFTLAFFHKRPDTNELSNSITIDILPLLP